MIYHLVLCQVEDGVGDDGIEELGRTARSQLLKIPEALHVTSGHALGDDSRWDLFYAVETESLDKLAILQDDPVYFKFIETVIKPNTTSTSATNYELEPGKDPKYS